MKIINVNAISLDGKIAAHPLESDSDRRAYGFTNAADHEFVREQLTRADAVVTGANSLRASGAAWQVRNHKGRFASWIVMTTRGLDSGLEFWNQTQTERWLVSPNALATEQTRGGVRNLVTGNENAALVLYDALKFAGFENVLLFGGGAINRLFYEAGLVDELRLTLCPVVMAKAEAANFINSPLSHPAHFKLQALRTIDDLAFASYEVIKP